MIWKTPKTGRILSRVDIAGPLGGQPRHAVEKPVATIDLCDIPDMTSTSIVWRTETLMIMS